VELMDYHVHSEFSYDATPKPEDLLEYAKKKSIDIIITDHYDVSSSEKFRGHVFNVENYERKLK